MKMKGQHHAPAALPSGTIEYEAAWPQNLYGRFGEQNNLLPCRYSNPGPSIP